MLMLSFSIRFGLSLIPLGKVPLLSSVVKLRNVGGNRLPQTQPASEPAQLAAEKDAGLKIARGETSAGPAGTRFRFGGWLHQRSRRGNSSIRWTRAHYSGIAEQLNLEIIIHGKNLIFAAPLLTARLFLARHDPLGS